MDSMPPTAMGSNGTIHYHDGTNVIGRARRCIYSSPYLRRIAPFISN